MILERIPWTAEEPPAEATLHERLARDGFDDVFRWHDAAGSAYAPHSHDHDESLWCVAGLITFGIAGREYPLGPGDRLMLPKGTVHTALVGPEGATYLIGQKG